MVAGCKFKNGQARTVETGCPDQKKRAAPETGGMEQGRTSVNLVAILDIVTKLDGVGPVDNRPSTE